MTTKTERSARVREVWNWLPAFRAVSETEHLPTAAERQHVTPAALSRSVRLLEETLARPLFSRVGRGLQITGAGERLAHAVRDAMRLVDDALDDVAAARLSGPFHVAAPAALTASLLDVADDLRAEHPELVVHLHGPHPDPAGALWRGTLDLVLGWRPTGDERLIHASVAELPTAVFARSEHPASSATELAALAEHGFVALGPMDTIPDPWPPGRARRIALVTSSLSCARAACERGLLATLPLRMGDGLTPVVTTAPLLLHAAARPALLDGGKGEVFAAALRDRLARASPVG